MIGPSNPITSILPILECEGIRSAIRDKFVVAVSPFIGNAPVSGPAGALMEAAGFEPTSIGTFNCYEGIPDIFIQDIRDPVEVSHSVRFDTLMTDEEKSICTGQAYSWAWPEQLKSCFSHPHASRKTAENPVADA